MKKCLVCNERQEERMCHRCHSLKFMDRLMLLQKTKRRLAGKRKPKIQSQEGGFS